jgi:hypothetical protein
MPMIRSLYPKNWDEISRRIKQSANWHCQHCGSPCLLPGEDFLDFLIRLGWTVGEALQALDDNGRTNPDKVVRFVLTTAHLNHKPEDCRQANLLALCAPCHCRMDLKALPLKRQLKLERQGQLNLFDLAAPSPAGHGKDPDKIQIPLRGGVRTANRTGNQASPNPRNHSTTSL